ncbi:hypothetical protein OOK60_01690 [Trichothermofontia sichuanensis B231]|uniref:hypothetical protein n=1 Tax=Trichothermofontia sichuanensis TaxID=3045816 RepID=UPI00224514AC|nr:hypothetical protein [Trichothermofontia sichuanensis]UZQ54821.1 hypothetical protein OOK60_01690 [Trichothermofontia sichuanensis B231]
MKSNSLCCFIAIQLLSVVWCCTSAQLRILQPYRLLSFGVMHQQQLGLALARSVRVLSLMPIGVADRLGWLATR